MQFLEPLRAFTKDQNAAALLDPDLRPYPTAKNFREQFLRLDRQLFDIYLENHFNPQLQRVAQEISVNRKISNFKDCIPIFLKESPELEKTIAAFDKHLIKIGARVPTLNFGIATVAIQALRRSAEAQERENYEKQLFVKFSSFDPKDPVMIEEFVKLEIGDLRPAAKGLDRLRLAQIISAAHQDKRVRSRLPRLLIVLPHARIEEFLHDFPEAELQKLNSYLHEETDVKEEWFQTMFKDFREGFVEECNQRGTDIDALCRTLRGIDPNEISQTHLDEIEKLKRVIAERLDTLNNLHIFINGLLDESEFVCLATKDLPRTYESHLERLNNPEAVGSPCGIIYRRAFDNFHVKDFDPSEKILIHWELDDDTMNQALDRYHFINDLKAAKIFNKTLLTAALQVK